MTWFNDAATRREVFATLPQFQGQFDALYGALWSLPQLPADILELCRLRMAQLHNSDTEWHRQEHPVPAGKRERLSHWHSDAQFSAGERACLEFTEVYAMDPQAITDDQATAVKAHFGEAGLVALVEALGLFFGLTRLSLLWQLAPENAPAPSS